MIIRLFLISFILLVSCSSGIAAVDSAWNGHTTPESTRISTFTPYYVPPGAKSYDSASPLIQYSGVWTDSFSPAYVQKTLRWTSHTNASVSFTFTGTGIELFGNTGPSHGVANVYIDGQLVKSVDSYGINRKQQRIFWDFDLPYGKHTIKVINTAARPGSVKNTILDLDALVVTKGSAPPDPGLTDNQQTQFSPGTIPFKNFDELPPSPQWTMVQRGTTGVHAMQLVVISSTHALIVDKVEHNPLTIDGHPAWAALYNLETDAVKPLTMQSNSFCAGGTFLSNGTMINVGGNPVVNDYTSAADFGDLDGLQAVRIFEPCDSKNADECNMYENHSRIRMASPRWYNTVIRISDGSAMIIGGSKKGGWINNGTVNNPSIEYFPPKSIHGSNGLEIPLHFLVDTLNANLFPIAFALSDGRVFMAANCDAMIYDWQNNKEQRLPQIPNGVRVTYPMTGTGLLLPLSPENEYASEILLCGGSSVDDTTPGYELSSQDPASAQCSRMLLTPAGIAAGWVVEEMPRARVMPDAVLLPTGDVLLVNGGASGIAGYGNVRGQVGASNADAPVLSPVLYKPNAPAGQRFDEGGMPVSSIPRLYHSVATLTPRGDVMVAGSNPNLDRSEVHYGTEYRVEWIGPPYMQKDRPVVSLGKEGTTIGFGETVTFAVTLPGDAGESPEVKVALMDLGYVTHGVHANSRLVYLTATLSADRSTLSVAAPPNSNIYPPGPGWVYVLVNDVPSIGMKVLIGDGKGPAVDEGAVQNLLAKTAVDQYEESKKEGKDDGGSE